MKHDAVPLCPICGRKAAERVRPFCSVRCADLDLGRWLTNSYAIPVEEDEDESADGTAGRGPPRRTLPGHDPSA